MNNPTAVKKATERRKKKPVPTETALQGIWSGTVSFSLVAIPVRLVKAVETGNVSFHLLHSKDHSPLERKMFCPQDEKIVAHDDIIKGFEIEPGKHVLITKQELESVSPNRSRTIEIAEFIDLREVDPIYYDHPYFLIPLKGGEKAYRLLAESMQRTDKAGLAKFVLDEREYLVLIMSRDGALAVTTLHYKDEILPSDGMVHETQAASNDEKRNMKKVIKGLISDFSPEKYLNNRREKLMDIINKKIQKKTEVEAPEMEQEENVEGMTDLMSALKKSMRKVRKNK